MGGTTMTTTTEVMQRRVRRDVSALEHFTMPGFGHQRDHPRRRSGASMNFSTWQRNSKSQITYTRCTAQKMSFNMLATGVPRADSSCAEACLVPPDSSGMAHVLAPSTMIMFLGNSIVLSDQPFCYTSYLLISVQLLDTKPRWP